MKKEKIEIKSKGAVIEVAEYESPETLEEAFQVDGQEKVLKLYLMERKTRFMDSRRRILTGGGVRGALAKAFRSAKPEQLQQLIALLDKAGVQVPEEARAGVKAMAAAGK